MNILTKILLIVIFFMGSVNLFAQDENVPGIANNQTVEVHSHDGFYLRLLYGVGEAELIEKDVLGEDFKFSGSADYFGLHLGGAIFENFIIYANIAGYSIKDPDIEWGDNTGYLYDSTLTVTQVGLGITVYTPINVYISASYEQSVANLETPSSDGNTDDGYGCTVMIGKEWWVSKNWGLGLALVGQYTKIPKSENYNNEIESKFFGVAFSATYN